MSDSGISVTGGGLVSMVDSALNTLGTESSNLEAKMAAISSGDYGEYSDQTTAMLALQFEIGQYNTLVELTSSITKDLSDAIENISQKV